jgi:imidazolonepropionase-like amidohydrolase
MVRPLTLACLSAIALLCSSARAESLLLQNARIVDPEQRREFIGHVWIEDSKVAGVLETLPAEFKGTVVDLTGKVLIPGLVDAHVHSWGNRAPVGDPDEQFGPEQTARRMLYSGVTAFLDLGLSQELVFAARQRLRDRAVVGADLYAAGPVFIGGPRRGPGPGRLVADTPADARRALDALAAERPDVVKLIFDWSGGRRSMSEQVMRALLERARELGLKTVVHIGTWENARLAVEAGATAITHLVDDADLPEELAQQMAAKKIYSIPTMAVQADFLDILENHALLASPLLRGVASAAHLERYRELDPVEFADAPTSHWQREGRQHYPVSIQRLHEAGVRIVAGSDTGNLGTFQGFSLHRELIQLERAGLPRWDALAAATTHAYELLGLDMGFKKGADASFVVLGASPLEDLANTQAIERVLFHGQWVDREALAVR